MASMSKPQARLVKEDRISALPHALICRILSFLPTMCAVRTAVLSRTWKKMWISLPTLDFDDRRDLFTPKNDCYGPDRFTKLVNLALFSRDSSDIQKLCLAISYPKNLSHIDDWICSAVAHNVAELDLLLTDETNGETSFQMPRSVFMPKTLKVLKVCSFGEIVTYDPPASGCFQSLKFLHVSVANPDEDSMEKLFSYCPVLENLTIDGFIDNGDGYKFKVYAPELKTLRIRLDERYEHENSSYINATSLENLELERVGLSNYFLENEKHVVNARIAFRALCEAERSLFPNRAIALLAGISNVRYLSLSAHCLEASSEQPQQSSVLLALSGLLHLQMLLKSTLRDKNSDRGGLMCWLSSPLALIDGSTKVCTALLGLDAEDLAASLALNLASFTSVIFDSDSHVQYLYI